MKPAEPLVFIDFETTGAISGLPSEPWQIGMVRLSPGGEIGQMAESLLRVGNRPFNPHAPGEHHRLRDQLAEAPELNALWPKLRPWLEGTVLCAHNISTERTILRKAFPLFHRPPWIDTLQLARAAWPDAPSHALEDLCSALDLHAAVLEALPGRQPHDALYDALCCARLFTEIRRLPGWRDVPIDDLCSRPARRR